MMFPPSPLPVIGVLPTKLVPGANSLTDLTPALEIRPINDAFTTPWPTDAHFVCYKGVNTGSDVWPRCNKPLLPQMRLKGADLHTTVFAFDYDRPGHKPWPVPLTEGERRLGLKELPSDDGPTLDQWLEQLRCVLQGWPLASRPSCIYTTRSGARLVYVLQRPLPVDEAESKHRWMVEEFCSRGLAIDRACSDWTRIFRLPFVFRDGAKTWESPLFHFEADWDARLDADRAESVGETTVSVYSDVRPFLIPKPSFDDALALLQAPNSNGRMSSTEWLRKAKQRLKNRECYPCLFEHAPLAEKGRRNDTLHAYLGQAISLLYYLEGTTPEHIFGLFLDPVLQLEPDKDDPDWTDTLWNHIGRIWAKEDAKARRTLQEHQSKAEQALSLADAVIDGMRRWCQHPDVCRAPDNTTALAAAHRYFIASVGNGYFVMSPSGWYDEMYLQKHQVVPRVREIGMDGLIQTQYVGQDGSIKDVPFDRLLRTYGTVVSSISAEPSIEGAYIKDIGQHNSTLVIPTYRRNPRLTPAYNPDVDQWLKVLFEDHYHKACEWIAWALAFEEGPICALSIEGEPGSGKQMLMRGLAECLQTPMIATAEDLVGSYQYGLLQSPFLWVNEGWPQSKAMGRHPADQFRALVSGDPIVCNRKYQSPVKVTNPVRIIFTANNAEVVRMLTGNRNLSPEDREALAIRLLHFKTGKRAAEWLRGKGGMRFTGEKGRRWVAAQGDNKSDYIVARHFLWLYANRGGVRGSRLLVEGNYNDDLIWEMRTQSGSAPLVVESLIQMIESARNYEGLVKTDDGRVYVLASEVLKHFRNTTMQRSSGERLNAQQIESVLKGLSVRIPDKPVELRERPQVGFARWYELDVECLLSSARRGGWVSPKLEKLVSARQVAREIEEKARQNALRTAASNGTVDASNKTEAEFSYARRVRDSLG